jgi:hypothetical protein
LGRLLFCEELNPDEIKATKISLGRRGRPPMKYVKKNVKS